MGKILTGHGRSYIVAFAIAFAPLFVPSAFALGTDFSATNDAWWQVPVGNWSTIQSQGAATTMNQLTVGRVLTYNSDPNSEVERLGWCFDLSSLGSDTITGATLKLFGWSNYGGVTMTGSVVSFAPSNPAIFTVSDYNKTKFGTTPFATQDMATQNIGAENDYAFNASGISYVAASVKCFGYRTADDIDGNGAGSTSVEQRTAFWMRSGSYPPVLTVFHTSSSSSSSSSSPLFSSGSLIIGHYACDHFAGSGASATCTDGSLSVGIPALRYFRNVQVDNLELFAERMTYTLTLFLLFYFLTSRLWRLLTSH